MKKNIDGKSIIDFILPCRVIGEPAKAIAGADKIDVAGPNQLSFCKFKGEKALGLIMKSKAGMIIVDEEFTNIDAVKINSCLLVVRQPRLQFIRCLNEFFFKKEILWEIHPTAIIGNGVVLPKSVSVGPYCVIGDMVKIGERTIIESNTVLKQGVQVGREDFIQSGSVIGCEGQGFERNNEGVFEKFPQVGGVLIGDKVEVGSNSTIVRGTLSDTVIGDGSKIGHLTDIGHNVKIGKHCFISAGVVVGGSAIIGDYCWLAPKCVIKQRTIIEANSKVGLGSVVINNVSKNTVVVGVPAKPIT